jgi:hypothetical protein
MTSEVIGGIDHLVIAVGDLDRAAADYRALGFTLSPRAVHSAQMGTANHTIMLREDYFELLGILTPTESNARWQAALQHGDGLAGLAAATAGAAAARAAWMEAGFTPSDIRAFSREVVRAEGARMQARFEIVTLAPDTLPALSIFACAQLTPEAVWLPELLAHPNTACAIRKVVIATPNPDAAARRWSRALPRSRITAVSDDLRIVTGRHAIDLMDPHTAARRYGHAPPPDRARAIAIEFAVADVAACRTALARGGVSVRAAGVRTTVIEPRCGVIIDFVSADAPLE